MRVVRTIVGVLVLLVALPMLLAGAGLWAALSHRDRSGAFAATVDVPAVDGYALVVADLDALLRKDAAFARGGDTGLRVTARTPDGPAFVGLAPAPAVARYLAGVAYSELTEVKLTRGRLPARLRPMPGTVAPPSTPAAQAFWLDTQVRWTPSAVRSQHLALVVMNPDGSAPVRMTLRAAVVPGWLPSTTWGVLVLGAMLLGLALVVLCWPERRREVVYVLESGPVAGQRAIAAPVPALSSVPALSGEPVLPWEPVLSREPALSGEPVLSWEPYEPVLSVDPAGNPRPPVTLALDWPPR